MNPNVLVINANSLSIPLADKSVQLIVTSPPYYGLRDYGVAGQIGLEQTPEMYVENLVTVFRECWRVLKDDGLMYVNLGDSYAGGGNYRGINSENSLSEKQRSNRGEKGTSQLLGAKNTPGCKPKDLIGIPWMVAFALRNDGWYLRQDIIWNKPNPMPESVTDRCTKSHEYVFMFSKSKKYYYDAEAIKEQSAAESMDRYKRGSSYDGSKPYAMKHGPRGAYSFARKVNEQTPPGQPNQHREDREDIEYSDHRNKRDVWTVTTTPYKDAHFATWPEKLVEPMILAGSKPGDLVLDPFSGSGTSGRVAIRLQRDYIGLELNMQYIALKTKRFTVQMQMI